jgi:hypothetical protein
MTCVLSAVACACQAWFRGWCFLGERVIRFCVPHIVPFLCLSLCVQFGICVAVHGARVAGAARAGYARAEGNE